MEPIGRGFMKITRLRLESDLKTLPHFSDETVSDIVVSRRAIGTEYH